MKRALSLLALVFGLWFVGSEVASAQAYAPILGSRPQPIFSVDGNGYQNCIITNPCYISSASGGTNLPYQPTPTGYSQLSAATLATAQPLNAPAGSNYCIVQPEGGAVRWMDSGTGALSATNGQILTDGQPMIFSGATQLAAVRIIAATYGGSVQAPVLNITCEK